MFLSKIKQTKPLSRKIITKKINFWKKHLQLNPKWDVSFVLHNNSLELPEDCQNMEAYIDIELGYWDAQVHFNGPLINEKNVDNVIVHELLHIIVEPLDNFALMSVPEKYHDQIRIFAESMIENLIPGVMTGVKS